MVRVENTPVPMSKGLKPHSAGARNALDKGLARGGACGARAPARRDRLMDFLKISTASAAKQWRRFSGAVGKEDAALSRSTVINAQQSGSRHHRCVLSDSALTLNRFAKKPSADARIRRRRISGKAFSSTTAPSILPPQILKSGYPESVVGQQSNTVSTLPQS